MSSEQVERPEAYYTAHNGELHKCYRAEDVEPLFEALEASQQDLKQEKNRISRCLVCAAVVPASGSEAMHKENERLREALIAARTCYVEAANGRAAPAIQLHVFIDAVNEIMDAALEQEAQEWDPDYQMGELGD